MKVKLRIRKNEWTKLHWLAAALVLVTLLIVLTGGYLIAKEIGLLDRISDPENPSVTEGFLPTDEPKFLFEDNQLELLVLGVDSRGEVNGSRSDTMMVVFLDMNIPSVKLLSIPRDTRVQIPGYAYEKFTHAHSYGGPSLVMETINAFLGLDVEHYVEVDFSGFKDVVDAVGGIELEVPVRMYYPAEDIDLYPGVQLLDGAKALQFVRYRSDGGDLVRIARQQIFLKELAKKALSTKNLWTATKLVAAGTEMTTTNLNGAQMLYIAGAMLDLDVDSIEVATVPGESKKVDGLWYIIADEEQTKELVDLFLNPSLPMQAPVEELVEP